MDIAKSTLYAGHPSLHIHGMHVCLLHERMDAILMK